ncbi:MAG: hypothetical protein JXB42_08145 [Deltaproteobacteria bacterium]|nr:hypothetical protein [Deltaproteobacteria bacterium]
MEQQSKSRFAAGRWSYLWLVLSLVFLIFSGGRWAYAGAPWLALPLLLRFVRFQKPLVGYLFTVVVVTISSSIIWYGLFPLPLPMWVLFNLMPALFVAVPYLADRLIARRLPGFLSTLIFPVAVTVMEYVMSFRPGSGTYGSLAYSQFGNLPLIQIVSITGIWGIVFLIAWFASTINYCWENGFAWKKIGKTAGIYLCVFAVVLLYGGARLIVIKPSETGVRVAAVTTPSDIVARIMGAFSGISPFHLQESLATLESQTVMAADAGARIIAWQEYGDLISTEDMDTFVKNGQRVAADKKIYLLIGVGLLDSGHNEKGENVTIFIDPDGKIAWRYLKSYLVPIIEEPYFKKGDKKIPVQDTPFGTIASVTCFDFDHPRYIRSAGHGIDLFLVPAFDGKTLTPVHSQMAVFRGIENGYSILKPTGEGLSIAADQCGRVIAKQNYTTSHERVMLADMPVKSGFTIYSVIGDAFAWLCMIGLIGLIVVAVIRGRQYIK